MSSQSSAADLETALSSALDRYLLRPLGGDGGAAPEQLSEAIRYSVLGQGKRIRPRLVLACSEMIGLAHDASLPAALALELIHSFSLIHDDLPCMDDDDFRRGKPSCHKAYGETLALLAGDALVPLASEVFSECALFSISERFLRAHSIFLSAIGARGMVGGQAAEESLDESSRWEDLLSVHEAKTGALFLAALEIPAALGGIQPDSPQGIAITRFGRGLGQAFQIADDLEDSGDAFPPSHALRYKTKRELRELAEASLAGAIHGLEKTFGPGSLALVAIAREISSKIAGTEKGAGDRH